MEVEGACFQMSAYVSEWYDRGILEEGAAAV